MMIAPKFLIVCGDGVNCENETAHAFELAQAKAKIVHINDLLTSPNIVNSYQGIAFPGGFSFADDLGSGQIMALKIKYGLGENLEKFIQGKKPVIGICNGFQILVKLGLLPDISGIRCMALAPNENGTFINRWVNVIVEPKTKCIWTSNMKELDLPVRNGEGRVVFTQGKERFYYDELKSNGQIALRYSPEDNNGSYERIAGVCDRYGLIFGLMPHPEAITTNLTHSVHSTDRKRMLRSGIGLTLFENAVEYLKNCY